MRFLLRLRAGGGTGWLTRLRSNSVDLQRSHERAPVPTAAADTDTFAGRADEWRLESYGVGVVSRTGRTRTATDTVGETEAEQGRRVRDTEERRPSRRSSHKEEETSV